MAVLAWGLLVSVVLVSTGEEVLVATALRALALRAGAEVLLAPGAVAPPVVEVRLVGVLVLPVVVGV